ncbi:hypothetical protein RRF57_005348 [Xylaria bambusicola]|uniref:NACHT domain-containing protein n=1 Tax=Xylaria bambusicola TaxID=326684 RepID=A0AAN7Z7Z7_9PEZI
MDTERNGPLEEANRAIVELLDLVGGDASTNNPLDGVRMIIGNFRKVTLTEVNWTLKRDKINDARRRLEIQKSIVQTALSTTVGIKDMERKRIIDHCLPLIPAMPEIHRDRKDQLEPETCNWVFREQKFQNWLAPHDISETHCRFICIHGIPGAGKTVLASSIIETVAKRYASRGVAYYYCLYSRGQDETIPFLKWILRLLCKQGPFIVPKLLEDAYETEEPLSVDELLQCLEAVSQHYRNGVYIIVDAVDESKPRENLVNILSRIGTEERFRKVSLLMTSREENEVMEPIRQLDKACTCISMSNKNVCIDLKRYVHERLIKIPVFNRLDDEDFLEEVENSLTLKANGMFRWAVCQLDVLRSKRDQESIRNALQTLPRDIFETYERILVEIKDEEKEFARTALALICSHTMESAEDLVNACLFCIPYRLIHTYDLGALKDILGSLISTSKMSRMPPTVFNRREEDQFHRCNLAHYTVKEYLFSPEIAKGKAKFFALSDRVVGNIDLTVIFTGLGHFGNQPQIAQSHRGRLLLMTRYQEYCLKMTQEALVSRRADIMHNDDLIKTRGTLRVVQNEFPTWLSLWTWETRPAETHTGILLNLATLRWRDLAKKYLDIHDFKKKVNNKQRQRTWTEKFKLRAKPIGTLLGHCLRQRQFDFLRIFVEHGRASFQHEPEALYTAMHVLRHEGKALENLEFLLRNGADPNPTPSDQAEEFAFTPLQLAVYMLEYDWIELLLDEGADVNWTRTGGVLPSCASEPGFEPESLGEISRRTCLEICSYAQPSWLSEAGVDEVNIRNSIRELLQRHGAEEPCQDIEMQDDSDLYEVHYIPTVDLTGAL